MKIESDNQLLTKSIKDKDSLQIKIDKINKNIKESSFSLQNWQSNFNKFLSEKIELDKEIELEKSKIESYLENILNLEKRLNKLIESSQNKNDLTVQAELLELSDLSVTID